MHVVIYLHWLLNCTIISSVPVVQQSNYRNQNEQTLQVPEHGFGPTPAVYETLN